MNTWLVASAWVGLALAAGMISVRTGISVAMVEIMVGVIGGNFLGLAVNEWVNFLAGLGAIILTFLAGAEVDPAVLKNKFKESASMGLVSFLFPFLATFAYTYYVAGWSLQAAQIAGIALSTTSVAIVYAVMVETRLNETQLGQIILAACFITDLGTVLALGVLFANYDYWMLIFIGATVIVLFLMYKITPWFQHRFGARVGQIEVKYVLFALLLLGGLAGKANSEAVLPAYLLGLALAGFFQQEKELLQRIRAAAFAFLTPFYFLKAGLFVSLPAVGAALGLILILLLVKVAAKFVGVWPLTWLFRYSPKDGMYTTLLMSTGLTFGTISSLFGLSHNLINQQQYTILVTVVIASGVIPTIIAQTFFRPQVVPEAMKEAVSIRKTQPAATEE
ncbi:cation:proton antiporter [Desulfofundulus thermobenzoicus]|uniref:Cation:proton antiporter n=1 Tax=Desulfofundulus thermobenzoicus TaxID=29376 RepID=A0A6N7INL4_9FIRM|nr:cation:proton antiporter [Desulfofundulus thermobenzoicus]MQL51606.1 cation:proton antiporter [Desulfofundulus thermobenzoicus]